LARPGYREIACSRYAHLGMTQVRKREFWNNAEAERLPDAWRMTKVEGDHVLTAVCEVWAVDTGWDLRLQMDGRGLQRASLCRSGREMVDRAEEWRAMLERGWEWRAL